MIAGPPDRAVGTPAALDALAGGDAVRAVWENQIGGITFEISGRGGRRFVKWAPAWSGVDPTIEADRLSWAAAFTPVPAVLGSGGDDSGSWLITAALPGDSAVSTRWKRSPRVAVTAVGEGLRALHEALPVDRCPFSWSVDDRLAEARRRASFGLIDQVAWHEEHQHLPVDRALAELDDPPAVDRLVVCHGDACAPNTLLGDDGRWTGHVDLGALGVGDRWADLAVATWSTQWNFGPGWEDCLLSAYGVAADWERTRYYRLLWDLGP